MYEHRSHPVLSTERFAKRLLWHFGYALLLLAVSLGGGMIGFHILGSMDWLDAFLNASMLLSGMGPVSVFHTEALKLFAGFYALYSGLAFAASLGILATPVVHRIGHRLQQGK